jgi:hypothetical protein
MSHSSVGYEKWVNFENLHLLNVLPFRLKKSLSDHFQHGQTCMKGFIQTKRGAVRKGLKSYGTAQKRDVVLLTQAHTDKVRG